MSSTVDELFEYKRGDEFVPLIEALVTELHHIERNKPSPPPVIKPLNIAKVIGGTTTTTTTTDDPPDDGDDDDDDDKSSVSSSTDIADMESACSASITQNNVPPPSIEDAIPDIVLQLKNAFAVRKGEIRESITRLDKVGYRIFSTPRQSPAITIAQSAASTSSLCTSMSRESAHRPISSSSGSQCLSFIPSSAGQASARSLFSQVSGDGGGGGGTAHQHQHQRPFKRTTASHSYNLNKKRI
jgi:hypothetical protein